MARALNPARSASPSEGTMAWHAVNQKILVEEAFASAPPRRQTHMVLSKQV